jgi:hypothetical protein
MFDTRPHANRRTMEGQANQGRLLTQSKSEKEGGRYVFSIRKLMEKTIELAELKAVSKANAR